MTGNHAPASNMMVSNSNHNKTKPAAIINTTITISNICKHM